MPSFTFVSSANAVVLRGAIPVFIDIRPDTLNIDEMKIEQAITPRTKAIFVTHYAGVPCEMDTINAIAAPRGLLAVEDAAQALMSTYKGIPAGRLGVIGCFSFHATNNVMCGEGGVYCWDARRFMGWRRAASPAWQNRSPSFARKSIACLPCSAVPKRAS